MQSLSDLMMAWFMFFQLYYGVKVMFIQELFFEFWIFIEKNFTQIYEV